MSIFSLFIGNNKPTVRRKGKRTKAKSYVNKDSVIALKLYNLMITIQSYPTICSVYLASYLKKKTSYTPHYNVTPIKP